MGSWRDLHLDPAQLTAPLADTLCLGEPESIRIRSSLLHLDGAECVPGKSAVDRESVQDQMLDRLQREGTPVSIYLVNGIRLQGFIVSFDRFAVLLKNGVTQFVYKQAISTIVPGPTATPSATRSSAAPASDTSPRIVWK